MAVPVPHRQILPYGHELLHKLSDSLLFVGFRDFHSGRSIYPDDQNLLQHSKPDAEGFLHWSIVPQPPPDNAYQASWQLFEWPVEGFTLGYLDSQIVGRERWNVLSQRWEIKTQQGYQPYRDDPLVVQEKISWKRCAPYNFLNHIAGDGILLVVAKSLGWYSSIPHHLGHYEEAMMMMMDVSDSDTPTDSPTDSPTKILLQKVVLECQADCYCALLLRRSCIGAANQHILNVVPIF